MLSFCLPFFAFYAVRSSTMCFYVRAVVDGVMATNYFSCQPLPSGTAPGIVTALKRAMAHADVDLDVWIRKLFFYCGDGASVVQGECGGIIRIVGESMRGARGQ